MALESDDQIRADAIGWHIRLHDSAAGDGTDAWEEFVDWLEADPARAEAYDRVALADAELDPVLAQLPSPPRAANDDRAVDDARAAMSRRGWFGAAGAAVAALVVAVVAGPALLGDDRYDIETRAGERRTVEIAAGSRVVLNGSSRITLDRSDARFASMERGEALFTIRHDAGAPFMLELGDDRVQDVGTVFNVLRENGVVNVEVAEGAVLYNAARENITLNAGQMLSDRPGAPSIVVGRKNPSSIGAWRSGRLEYQGAPFAAVAADLTRNLGARVTVAPAIAARSFTGTIRIDDDDARTFARVAALLDADTRRTGDGWTIGPKGRAAR